MNIQILALILALWLGIILVKLAFDVTVDYLVERSSEPKAEGPATEENRKRTHGTHRRTAV